MQWTRDSRLPPGRAADRDRIEALGSANERFKARWGARLAGSTAIAVTVHAVLLLAAGWTVLHPPRSSTLFLTGGLVLLPAVVHADEGAAGPLPVAAPPLDAGSETDLKESDAPTAPEAGSPTERASPFVAGSRGDDLFERLRSRGMPRPTLAPPIDPDLDRPNVESEPVTASEEEDPTIGGEAATTGLSGLPASDSLRLERLSEIRPELALATPTAWVLIRNPTEVERYLRTSYRRGLLDPAATGSVSMTLWIDERGSVQWAEISRSSGRTDLDEFALTVFNEVAVFRPARQEGVSVSRSVTFALTFPW